MTDYTHKDARDYLRQRISAWLGIHDCGCTCVETNELLNACDSLDTKLAIARKKYEMLAIAVNEWDDHCLPECDSFAHEDSCPAMHITTLIEQQQFRIHKYEKALREIKQRKDQVCEDFELCTHPVCKSSYEAFAIADMALRKAE